MRLPFAVLAAVLAFSACSKKEEPGRAPEPPAPPPAAGAEAEKAAALASPYPSDLGPDWMDVAAYPEEAQEGYRLLKAKCAACHTAARPLNHRFVEPEGADDGAKEAAVARLKTEHPDWFADRESWQVEAGVWKRYVKRMMAKPGCGISPEEGKSIWAFLVEDGGRRKLGKAAASWREHRKRLLAEFKAKHPQRYAELAASGSL